MLIGSPEHTELVRRIRYLTEWCGKYNVHFDLTFIYLGKYEEISK